MKKNKNKKITKRDETKNERKIEKENAKQKEM